MKEKSKLDLLVKKKKVTESTKEKWQHDASKFIHTVKAFAFAFHSENRESILNYPHMAPSKDFHTQ